MANIITTEVINDSNKKAIIKVVGVIDTAAANTSIIRFNDLAYALNATGHISNTNPRASYDVKIRRVFGSGSGAGVLNWENTGNTAIVGYANGQFDYDFSGVSPALIGGNASVKGLNLRTIGNGVVTIIIDVRKGADFDQGQGRDPAAFNKGDWSIK